MVVLGFAGFGLCDVYRRSCLCSYLGTNRVLTNHKYSREVSEGMGSKGRKNVKKPKQKKEKKEKKK